MRVCIDAGHGGNDPGAVASLVEKDINLKCALELGKYLQFLGIEVIYTRTTDVFVELADRATIANGAGCDYFISVHFNAGGGQGIEIYCYATGGTGDKLASAILPMLQGYTGLRNRGVKINNFQVLRETAMPAILIEGGFVDTSDAATLLRTDYPILYAAGVSKGFCEFTGIAWRDMYAQPAPVPPAPQPAPTTDTEKEQLKAKVVSLSDALLVANAQLADSQKQLNVAQDELVIYRSLKQDLKKLLGV